MNDSEPTEKNEEKKKLIRERKFHEKIDFNEFGHGILAKGSLNVETYEIERLRLCENSWKMSLKKIQRIWEM